MTTFTAPLRLRLKDGYGADVSAATNGETYLGGAKFGYSTGLYPVYYSYTDFGIASGTPAVTKSIILPAGSILHNVFADIRNSFVGTSLATPTFNIGLGAQPAALMTNIDASAKGRKPFYPSGVSAGVSLMGTAFSADTTLTFTISVSGTATQTVGPLSAGDLTLFIELG